MQFGAVALGGWKKLSGRARPITVRYAALKGGTVSRAVQLR